MIQQWADKAVGEFAGSQPEGYKLDPAMILMFIELFMKVVEAWRDCRTPPESAAVMASSPTWLQQRILRWWTRRMLGRRGYAAHGRDMVHTAIVVGASVTVDQIVEAYEEV